ELERVEFPSTDLPQLHCARFVSSILCCSSVPHYPFLNVRTKQIQRRAEQLQPIPNTRTIERVTQLANAHPPSECDLSYFPITVHVIDGGDEFFGCGRQPGKR